MNQEGTMVERVEPTLERSLPKSTNALVTEVEAALAIPVPEAAPPTTPMPILALATTSQDMPGTPTTAKTLLLLTSRPQFDRIATPASSAFAKSLAANTDKLPSRAPSNAEAFLNATEVQMDLMLANQHTIMANQCELQTH